MSEKSDEFVEINLSLLDADDAATRSLGDFSKSEIERTRSFKYAARAHSPKLGTIDNMTLFVKYDRANAEFSIEFDEAVGPFHIVRGTTRIALIDEFNTRLAEWDFELFRTCGSRRRSFSGTTTRSVAERVTGLQFFTVGSASARRCP